jgi:fumarate reductase flavoprotein subunit
MKVLETEIVVIGGGDAGLSAAIAAAQKDASVIVFEKGEKRIGGPVGGLFAVESRMQWHKEIGFTREDAFNFFMNWTHWRADARLVSEYVNKSASTIEWLQELGIVFDEHPIAYFPGAEFVWHYIDMHRYNPIEIMTAGAKELGVDIYFETPVKKIIRKGDRVEGVIAENKDGETIQVNAKAVIVATGGFGDNAEMIKKYTTFEWGKDLFSFKFPGLTGDGIQMAWEVGAAQSEMNIDSHCSLPQPYNGPGGTSINLGSFRQPNLLVNLSGERFMNEEVMFNIGFAGHAIHRQKEGCAFAIFDEETNKYFEETDWDLLLNNIPVERSKNLADIINKAREEGYQHLFTADSLEELCAQTGINLEGLRQTVDEYNHVCETGRDEIFHKKARYLRPVKQPRFYAGRLFPFAMGSLGGIKINYKTEVLDNNDDVIPGLYAVGVDANNIWGGSFPFALHGNITSFDINSGRMAGENSTEYIKTFGK